MSTHLDSSRLSSLLSHLEGTLTLEAVAARHGVPVGEVESWKALYLSGARAHAGLDRAPSRARRVAVGGGLAIAAALFAVTAFAQTSICSSGWPTQLVCFAADNPALASDVNANFKKVWEGTVPVGTIVAWHKSLGASTLPSSWVECNGQSVSDTASPYNGQTVPNLNTGRFLRGAATSGVMQDDAFQGHKHNLNAGQDIHLLNNVYPTGIYELWGADQRSCTGAGGCSSGYYDIYRVVSPSVGDPVDASGGSVRWAGETRPSNMSVVWVMRIK